MILILFALLLSGSPADAAPKRKAPPVVATIEGGGAVTIRGPAGERQAKLGGIVQYGETVITGPDNALTLKYPDGSLLAVNKATEIEVQERIRGAQWNKLVSGEVRGLIEKPKALKEAVSKKPHFMIRTKAAVLGVRGTDFIMGFEPYAARTKVYTLEGVVSLGKDEKSLFSGQAADVTRGQYIESTGNTITKPEAFDAQSYLQKYKAENLSRSAKFELPPAPAAMPPGAGAPTPGVVPPPGDQQQEEPRQDAAAPSPLPAATSTPPPAAQPPREKKKPKLLSFQLGGFFLREQGQEILRTVSFSWNPTFPILRFFYLRGHLGWNFARNASLYEKVWIAEYQLLAGFVVLDQLFFEAGAGEQIWRHTSGSPDSGMFSVNAGFQLDEKGFFDRIYVGHTNLKRPQMDQFRAGVGFKF